MWQCRTAAEGLRVFTTRFAAVFDADLIISAMGQAFFSMSLGVGTMLVYASYVSDKENLPVLGASVALVDIGGYFGWLVNYSSYVCRFTMAYKYLMNRQVDRR